MQKINPDVLLALDISRVEGNTVFLPPWKLNRKIYVDVNRVLEALGGKWNRKVKGHIFEDDPAAALESVILTGEYTNKKADFGFFETPFNLAKEILDAADLHTSHTILEPSAGRGALLEPLGNPGKLLDTFQILTCEILPDNAQILKRKGYACMETDFLTVKPTPEFDRVVMNPPFAKQADIDHVTHAFKFLKPGGRLVAIMSFGVQFRCNSKACAFSELVRKSGGTIYPNSDGAFKESGTMVRTVTVTMDN